MYHIIFDKNLGINIYLNLLISNGLHGFDQTLNTNVGNAEIPVEKDFQRNASFRKSKTGTKNKVIKPSSDPSKLAKG